MADGSGSASRDAREAAYSTPLADFNAGDKGYETLPVRIVG